jgi:hypothetical protein
MRRLTTCIGIALLTLLVNGWGVVLAAALCPHGGVHKSAAMAENQGCHAQASKPESSHSGHQSSHGAKKVVVESSQSNGLALDQRAGSCAHCISQKNLPATLAEARELNVKKVDVTVAQPVEPIFALSMNFAPRFIPTQHAPPIASNRKHLLLGVFLI